MDKTKIEWCDSTWNPVTGCLHNCEYCYARNIANRFSYTKDWAAYPANLVLDEPIRDALTKKVCAYPHGFAPTFHRYRLDQPKKWKEPRNIFVCSMADLFGKWVPDEWIEEVYDACEAAPQHNYIFLTKNVDRYTDKEHGVPIAENMWYGISITGEAEVSQFNRLPAGCNTFVSIEPLLEDLDVAKHDILFKQVDWVIIGAETGGRKNKVVPLPEWINAIVDGYNAAKTPVFMKDSLIPIIGEENMRRELPRGLMR